MGGHPSSGCGNFKKDIGCSSTVSTGTGIGTGMAGTLPINIIPDFAHCHRPQSTIHNSI